MMKVFISLLIILLSFIMLFLNHPLSMGFMILIQTLLTCIITSMIMKTYWMSYILFLTFLGGLLVLFIYVSSIASNELFKLSISLKMLLLFNLIIILMISMFFNNNLYWINLSINNLEMNNFFNMFLFFNNENKINLSKLYNNQTFLMMMMMIIYLFIALIAVVKITNIFYGPLRSSFN
uniref:NADH-ubiquinone oxidoreductase chain 6 n=2 Tax=Ostrinia TaxID=29056 RepID=Q8WBV3_OSTNU|nr:NADH dehydrogenase subunit 6 [Ostrinia scapulalis]YP_010044344.1 NADH dehydrogenase subunit 6 [Ostrinia nubilalis]AAL66248.1 NADH dehydrogenase subunit 6 [Ostrinia nubilalis]QKK36388.1 NADH dehydrogenase subunit 6 [Ostrinia nubilalis]QKK36414.1 NADH dehydrogenase subunit 6 [Ostrinia scapulalis]QOL11950.1 NADH dehydrogenase subunit 6 [Ostrinia scapulalis]QPF23494.1 NADH dehydrogenase subunit 6 [Ostrinia nubilalis]